MKLRTARKQANKTQPQIAKDAGISVAQYQNIEYGKNEPRVTTAIRIADSLNVNVKDIF